jgi:signal transduction histidine kinase
MPSLPASQWAIYLPRAVMNAQVWVNGVPMAYTGSTNRPVTRNWYVPLLLQVPALAWREGDNLVWVKVVNGVASRDGLSEVMVGPVAELAQPYKWRSVLQVEGVYVANIALLALGVLMVIVWWRDREQASIGLQGAAAVFWSIGVMAIIAPNPFLSETLWEHLSFTAMFWSELFTALFFLRFAGRRSAWMERLIVAMMLGIPVWFLAQPSSWLKSVAFCAAYGLSLIGLAHAMDAVIRHKRRDRIWLFAVCAMLVPAGIHDALFQMGLLAFDTIYTMPYCGPLMMGCMFYILAGDYARSRQALNTLNDSLAETLVQREQVLRASFARVAELERAQAVSAERSRILQDMHDGVGAHLTSALRQLQQPSDQTVDLGLVTQTLRDSLDQLKLSVDALSLQAGDVVGLLASLRFRVSPRLKAAGLELIWDVADLPDWPDGHAPALRQLQYILFEGLSNVLQHSGATRLSLVARAGGDHLRVSLIDNGRGWRSDGGEGEGNGLQTMRARARLIGARITFHDVPEGGMELRISLPMHEVGRHDLSCAA